MMWPWRPLVHAEWWQTAYHGNTQISSFYTALVWSVHHSAGFLAVLLAWAVLFHARVRPRALKPTIVLLLLAPAFYCSPFSVMPLPLFAWPYRRVILRRLLATPAAVVVALLSLVPLYLFLDKPETIRFAPSGFRLDLTGRFWVDKLLSLPVYLTLVPLVEFGGVPLLLPGAWRSLHRVERAALLAAARFFLLTYGVAFVGANDFCMRGMLLPTFVFYVLFARHAGRLLGPPGILPPLRRALAAIALLGLLGTMHEWATLTVAGLYRSTLSWRLRHRTDLPHGLARLGAMDSRAIARDPRIVSVPYDSVADLGYDMYSLEKLVDRKRLAQMERGEIELLRYP